MKAEASTVGARRRHHHYLQYSQTNINGLFGTNDGNNSSNNNNNININNLNLNSSNVSGTADNNNNNSNNNNINNIGNNAATANTTTPAGQAARPVVRLTHRHLAALDFLLNIPMGNESSIRESGIRAAKKKEMFNNGDSMDNINELEQQFQQAAIDDIAVIDAPGKKLPGTHAHTVRFPPAIKYQIQKITENGAPYIQWADQFLVNNTDSNNNNNGNNNNNNNNNNNMYTATGDGGMNTENKNVLNSRLFFSRARGYPVSIFSVTKYDAEREKRRRQLADNAMNDVFDIYKQGYRAAGREDWRGANFKQHLNPISQDVDNENDMLLLERGYLYNPTAVDDPNMKYGDERYVMKQQADIEAPVMISIIKYVNKDVLKENLNQKYRETHDNLPASLTLSKIRNLKRKAILMALSLNIEVSTIALAVINFERLCLKSLVSKENRKLAMAVCIVLSYKFMDPLAFTLVDKESNRNESEEKEKASNSEYLESLFDYFDKEWRITRKQILDAELGVFVQLGFSLHVPRAHLDWVFWNLLSLVHKEGSNYLNDMDEVYKEDVLMLERLKTEIEEEKERAAEEEAKAAAEEDTEVNEKESDAESRGLTLMLETPLDRAKERGGSIDTVENNDTFSSNSSKSPASQRPSVYNIFKSKFKRRFSSQKEYASQSEPSTPGGLSAAISAPSTDSSSNLISLITLSSISTVDNQEGAMDSHRSNSGENTGAEKVAASFLT